FAFDTATYVTHSSTFGWLVFGGNLSQRRHVIQVTPLDAFRMRVYLAPFGLWLRLDAGRFRSVSFDPRTRTVHLVLDPATEYAHRALLRISQPATITGLGHFRPEGQFRMVRGAYAIPLHAVARQIVLRAAAPAAVTAGLRRRRAAIPPADSAGASPGLRRQDPLARRGGSDGAA
ncbi:MAG: DUF5695 domain-containing protein, partial [Terriglobales bacterium]